MPAHEIIKSTTGINRETGETYGSLVASIRGYPDWEVAVIVVLTADGTVALGDLHIRPRGFPEDDDHPSAADVPSGGIPARLVRAINAGELLDLHQRSAREALPKMALREDREDFVQATARLAEANRTRSGRKGNGIDHYLGWAVRYAEKVRVWRPKSHHRTRT